MGGGTDMTLEIRGSENYAATVVRVKHVIDLENCDNVVGINVFGYQAIVGKDTQVGDLMVVFPAETQLSEAFASAANLFRHSEKNADPTAKGYLEDNRRVRAMKFRGHRSDALALPLGGFTAAAYRAGVSLDTVGTLDEGATFDTLDGIEICRKYVIKTRSAGMAGKTPQEKAFKRVELPLHYDTANYFRNQEDIPDDEYVVATQKLHGTSVRFGWVPVPRDLSWWQRILIRVGVPVVTKDYRFVVGSRKVIKSVV